MRIKFFFFILVLFLLGLGGMLVYLLSGKPSLYLYVLEGLIGFILIYLIVFYNKIVKPMNTIGSGMELLREQDFSSRLSRVGQYEADRIVNIFNRMMEQLKNERLRMREQNHFLDLLIQASPMGVIILTMDDEVSQLNPMAVKMLGVRMEEAMAKRLDQMDSPLAAELSSIPKDETAVVRLNDANIYKCTHSSFIDRGFKHPFFLIERMTEEVMRAEKRAYEKVIRMIAHEVNNTTAGITSTLDTVEQALSTEDDMEDICDVMRVCTERCFSMSRFITRFADVVKIPEPDKSAFDIDRIGVKASQFSFSRLHKADPVLGVDMSSTGEVGCIGDDFSEALLNAMIATGFRIPRPEKGVMFSSGAMKSKVDLLDASRMLFAKGYKIYATAGTAAFLNAHGVTTEAVYWPDERPDAENNVMTMIADHAFDLIVNIPKNHTKRELTNGYKIRRGAIDHNIPLITNARLASAFIEAFCEMKLEDIQIKSWQEYK